MPTKFDTTRFENIHQMGGIQLGVLQPTFGGGLSEGSRVALVNTGSGLRFTVALDRGGDIVDAHYNQHSLAYLSPNGLRRPNHAYNQKFDWLANWPAGLVTTCGPQYIGHPRTEDDQEIPLHGNYSNTPSEVQMVLNPDLPRGKREMLISLVTRDSRMFGPVIEVRRQIQCILGEPVIHIYDQVTNRATTKAAHHWLYHVNLGYPLLNAGSRFIYKGDLTHFVESPEPKGGTKSPTRAKLEKLKRASGPIKAHRGNGEYCVLLDPIADKDGLCHVGLVNPKLNLALELEYPQNCLPRLTNWQHFDEGSYVTGIEPYSGSLIGKDRDTHKTAEQYLAPGQTKRYQMTIRIHGDRKSVAAFAKHDGPVKPA